MFGAAGRASLFGHFNNGLRGFSHQNFAQIPHMLAQKNLGELLASESGFMAVFC